MKAAAESAGESWAALVGVTPEKAQTPLRSHQPSPAGHRERTGWVMTLTTQHSLTQRSPSATMGTHNAGIAEKHHVDLGERLIVLRTLNRAEAKVVYDGPGAPVWDAAGPMQEERSALSSHKQAPTDAVAADARQCVTDSGGPRRLGAK
jgi:hypothetical protein